MRDDRRGARRRVELGGDHQSQCSHPHERWVLFLQAPQPVGDSTPVTAPDATGLPVLSEPDPAIVIGQLDNGLRYFIRDNDNPGRRVEMRLAVDAGSALEDETQDGGAHFDPKNDPGFDQSAGYQHIIENLGRRLIEAAAPDLNREGYGSFPSLPHGK